MHSGKLVAVTGLDGMLFDRETYGFTAAMERSNGQADGMQRQQSF